MIMVADAADRHGWEPLRLWKKDLQGAFNLLWFAPAAVHLLAFLLTAQLVVIHLAGMFGWTAMPHAFDVVTRYVRALVRHVIHQSSAADMYVDDIVGVSHQSHIESDMLRTDAAVRGLLGPEAIAVHKDETGRSLDWIGWSVDLDTRRVTLSRRNLLRTIYAFFNCELSNVFTLQAVERLASLASRCSTLARQMRPYTKSLYDCAALYASNHQRRHLSAAAKVDVLMWRTFLIAVHFDPVRVARPIMSFRSTPPTIIIEYDASLSAFGVGVSTLAPTPPHRMLGFAALPAPFAATVDSSFQNSYEYLAVVLGLLLARRAHLRSFSYVLAGDSISSLHWARNDRAASTLARRANIAFTLLSCDIDASVAETVHVPGTENVVYDGLSRGATAAAVHLDSDLQVHLSPEHPITRFLAICDPALPLVSHDDHLFLSADLLALLADPLFYA
jgi:hypothetical protein